MCDNRGVVMRGTAFGTVVRRRRVELGLTQRDLAELADLSVRTIGKIEQGRLPDTLSKSIDRVISTLGIDPEIACCCSDSAIRVSVLGPLAVQLGGVVQELGAQKQRCLLGLLALRYGTTVSRDEIVELLWGTTPPPTWQNLIHTYVTRLRKALGNGGSHGHNAIVTAPSGYRLTLGAQELDIAEFDALLQQGENPEKLAAALDQWRGPVLADLPDRLRWHPAAVSAQERRISAAMAYADAVVEPSRQDDVIRRLQALIVEAPMHEGLLARVMLALAAAGRQADAISLYAGARQLLGNELGVDPSAELRSAHERVLRQDVPAKASRFVPAQLPADVVCFSGRRHQLAALDSLLAEVRGGNSAAMVIAAIAGSAGVGKTALALHWGHKNKHHFPDGQLYVNLRGYDPDEPVDPADALAAFLRALGVETHSIPRDVNERSALFRTVVADRRMLMILDNAQAASVVRPLLPGTSEAFVVITSRDSLRGLAVREGARLIDLGVLSLAESRALMTTLIGDRVTSAPEASDALVEQCGHLPLAIRLVADLAARKPDVDLVELAEELADEQHRLRLLDAGDDPYASIGAVFSWSYNKLSAEGARLFRLLGLLPGNTLDVYAAAVLLNTSREKAGALLDELADAHLLDRDVNGRFRFHDLLRAYARQKAGQEIQEPAQNLIDFYRAARSRAASVLAGNGRVSRANLLGAFPAVPIPTFAHFVRDAR
ncbi:DNA-binding transcriptional activator of the SARP family [Kibdelosporangium aridum]|uniref:DNA-binding transcriptional activator of the SARP family n=2 Tax=Kibdelosporangium aridum TaxID=2030 RepID=A0A1Y5WYR3_KIBAR|nr:DNA-binding transcriptional activator of the SARP family [Kibdelosporangium aridum]